MGVDPSSPGAASAAVGAQREVRQLHLQALTVQATQREADEWKVDRSTVVPICRVAEQGASDALAASVPGRPGQSGE